MNNNFSLSDNMKYGFTYLGSRFRESETGKKQKNKNRFSSHFLYAISFSMLMTGIVSCGSSKPRVITTKKEAARYPESTTTSRSQSNRAVVIPRDFKVDTELDMDKSPYEESTSFIDEVVDNALRYQGTRYKYGGTTSRGMDCSGLICAAFKEAGKTMPRTSSSMYAKAKVLDLEEVRKGDFLFFATGKKRSVVNHVALVTQVTPGEITFIHSTTSRGVMTSSLNEAYWLNAFLKAGRIH